MKRIHLFEFEDFDWFPIFIRDGGTDFLGFILKNTDFYSPAIELLEEILEKTSHHIILDLCSGNGGPIKNINQKIDPNLDIQFILSDKYPNIPAFEALKSQSNGKIDYLNYSFDLLKMNSQISGFRTIFSAIHHFKPAEVKIILDQIIKSNMPIGIFDSGDKHLATILGMIIFHPIIFFFCTPFFKPFKLSRIIFTYLIPLIPLYTIWDGIISILRLYEPTELLNLALVVDKENRYIWKFGKRKNSFGFSVTYLIGIPK